MTQWNENLNQQNIHKYLPIQVLRYIYYAIMLILDPIKKTFGDLYGFALFQIKVRMLFFSVFADAYENKTNYLELYSSG